MSNQPFFSVVMPSYLEEYAGNYGHSAKDREAKFQRAVRSVIDQDQQTTSWELIIVADGCARTMAFESSWPDPRIRFIEIPKQRIWSAKVRNTGIRHATGEYVVYLDTDDRFGPHHLVRLRSFLYAAGFPKWAIFDDQVWDPGRSQWVQRVAEKNRTRGAGTSQITHRVDSGILWPEVEYRHPAMGYDHDEQFFRHLKQHHGGDHIGVGEYYVCHVPRQYEV